MNDAAAVAIAIGGPVVGVAGVFFGWLNARGERTQAASLTQERHLHERQVARSQRVFDGKENAYRGLLRQLSRALLVIERTHPIIGPVPPPPERPTDDEWDEMFTDVALFGSEKLRDAFETFATQTREFHAQANTYEAIRGQQVPMAEVTQAINKAREDARETLRSIERLMRDELAEL